MFIADAEVEERAALRRAVRDLITRRSPESAVRAAIESPLGYDAQLWAAFADMGLQSLAIPEEFGGGGAGVGEQAIVFQELGRGLVPAPFLSSVVLGGSLILSLADRAAARDYLPGIGGGSLIATVALADSTSEHDHDYVQAEAKPAGGGWTITGERRLVLDGSIAGLILVPVQMGSGTSVLAVEFDPDHVSRIPLTTLDLTRGQADLVFDRASARLLGEQAAAGSALEAAVRRGVLALVAEQTGAAEHLMAISLQYAKTRSQFGRVIGEFQAIQHKLADMAFDLERMKSALRCLVEATESGSAEAAAASHLAKAFASEALFRIAADTIQVHGGIGFNWEHEAHLYYRRAKSTEALLGPPHIHRELMLKLVEEADVVALKSPASSHDARTAEAALLPRSGVRARVQACESV